MASAQVVETSVNTNNSPSQDYTTMLWFHCYTTLQTRTITQATTLTHLGLNLSLLYINFD